MKKIYLLFLLFCLAAAKAQVPNAGFEETFGYGLDVANWGQFYVVSAEFNPDTNEFVSDDITWGDSTLGGFTCADFDPHTGERALLVRNAFNITKNEVIAGKANLFNTDISDLPTGWNTGIPVAPDAVIESLGFWYKFFPMGNDVAEARLELFNSGGESLGKAVVPISGAQSDWNYIYTPIDFTSSETPAFMTIEFSMAQEGSEPVFGSSLVIDDVKVNSLMLHNNTPQASLFAVYPTAADNQINIVKNASAENTTFNLSIIDMTGKLVKQQSLEITGSPVQMDVSQLAKGTYILKAESGNVVSTTKFLKI